MSTERQKAANRANAQKSTGPTSAEGKSRVSSNATRHGATGRGPFDRIISFYEAITQHVGGTPPGRFDRSAWRLAEAEAQLVAARKAHQEAMFEKLSSMKEKAERKNEVRQIKTEFSSEKEFLSVFKNLDNILSISERYNIENLLKKERLLQRYLTEAETGRASAFKAWISRHLAKQL